MFEAEASQQKRTGWIVAMTGASGTVYGRRLIAVLAEYFPEVPLDLILSEAAFRVMREEEGIKLSSRAPSAVSLIGREAQNIKFHGNENIGATIASGSHRVQGMVVAPCSMATLSAISSGYSHNLIHRAADVCLKEGRKLILLPRETPLSTIHLENMLKLSRMGVSIAAAMPGFYHKPQSVEELVDMMVMRVLDLMGLDLDLVQRWGSKEDLKVVKYSDVICDIGTV